MKLRLLLSLLLAFLVFVPLSSAEPELGRTVAKGLVLKAAEFGLITEDAGGTVKFEPSTKIALVPGQVYGWRLQFDTKRQAVSLREELQLPVPPKSWSSSIPEAEFQVSADGRTGTTKADAILANGVLMNAWKVAEGDPAGEYVIRLFIDGQLVRTFKFEGVAP